jgi:hypothetical protein
MTNLRASGLVEKARKSWEYAFSDVVVQLAECVDIDPFGQPCFAEQYAVGRFYLECSFPILDKFRGQHAQYVAILERSDLFVEAGQSSPRSEGESDSQSDRGDLPMLIPVSKSIENPEPIRLRAFPRRIGWGNSIVRLKRLDLPLGFVWHEFKPRVGLESRWRPLQENGEFNLGNRPLMAGEVGQGRVDGERQLPREVVEGGAGVVGKVADDQPESGRWLSENPKPDEMDRIFRCFVCHDGVWIWPLSHERFQLALQRCEVFVRPFQFQEGLAQRWHEMFEGNSA